MAETQTPSLTALTEALDALELLWGTTPLLTDARAALAQVEALAASMRRIKLKVEVGRSGGYTFADAGKAIAWIDAECNLALAPFTEAQP